MKHLSNVTKPMPAMGAVELDAMFQKLGRAMASLTAVVNFADLLRSKIEGDSGGTGGE